MDCFEFNFVDSNKIQQIMNNKLSTISAVRVLKGTYKVVKITLATYVSYFRLYLLKTQSVAVKKVGMKSFKTKSGVVLLLLMEMQLKPGLRTK